MVAVKPLTVRACAKLNLGLEVLGRREDGYHELRTIFQTIDLSDVIRIGPAPSGIELASDDPGLPLGEANLAYRAADQLRRRAGVRAGARIEIRKRIPVAGGLGGGSSDAAAVLLALDRLWGLGLGRSGLWPLARRVGADVPYFLLGGTALGLARGDEVYPLAEQVRGHVVLVDPGRPVSTAAVFARVAERLTPRENSSTISRFVSSDLRGAVRFGILANELEQAALVEAPDLVGHARRIRAMLARGGAVLARMSGSGSTFFGLFEGRAEAAEAKQALEGAGYRAWLTRTLSLRQYRDRWARSLRGVRTGASGATR